MTLSIGFVLLTILVCLSLVSAQTTRCGASWAAANTGCGRACKTNGDCSGGQTCYANLNAAPCAGQKPPPAATGSGTVRCGTNWAAANSNCGRACKTNADCPSGQSCFNALKACGKANPPPPPPPRTGNTPLPPTSGSGCGFLVTESHLKRIMERPNDNLAGFVNPLNYALRKYQMDCPNRVTAFLAQVRHETAALTTFYQPADNGAGALHMVPSNWLAMCQQITEIKNLFSQKFRNCGNCECVSAMASNPMGADTTRAAKEIFATPLPAFLSGAWWFVSGSRTPSLLGWKGCGDLRLNSDAGLGGPGAGDCKHSGYYQVSCCIFGSVNEAGFAQRLRFYNLARSVIPGASRAIADHDSSNVGTSSSSGLSDVDKITIGISVAGIVMIAIIVVLVVFKESKLKKREETV